MSEEQSLILGAFTGRHALVLSAWKPDGTRLWAGDIIDGLTIGRTPANSISLAYDEAADRTHARIHFDNGTPHLRCLGNGNHVIVEHRPVCELPLIAGTRFSIGQTRFECQIGASDDVEHELPDKPLCPFCKSTSLPSIRNKTSICLGCGQPILVLSLVTGVSVVPGRYKSYSAMSFVAQGGMGVVLRGETTKADEDTTSSANLVSVAIKLLPPLRVSRNAAERFRREIQMLKSVRHPNVVRLLDFGRTANCNFLVTDWIDGRTLHKIIADHKVRASHVNFEDALNVFKQVCEGLAAIHTAGIVHRDVKPSNILVDDDGRAYISDLGIGRRLDEEPTDTPTTGKITGTYDYMAPEQRDTPETVDQRADLYALGRSFYELLTFSRADGAWRPASEINPSVPSWFDQILACLLAAHPANRYSAAKQVLAAISQNESISDEAEPEIERQLWLAGLAAVTVVFLIVWWLFHLPLAQLCFWGGLAISSFGAVFCGCSAWDSTPHSKERIRSFLLCVFFGLLSGGWLLALSFFGSD